SCRALRMMHPDTSPRVTEISMTPLYWKSVIWQSRTFTSSHHSSQTPWWRDLSMVTLSTVIRRSGAEGVPDAAMIWCDASGFAALGDANLLPRIVTSDAVMFRHLPSPWGRNSPPSMVTAFEMLSGPASRYWSPSGHVSTDPAGTASSASFHAAVSSATPSPTTPNSRGL